MCQWVQSQTHQLKLEGLSDLGRVLLVALESIRSKLVEGAVHAGALFPDHA